MFLGISLLQGLYSADSNTEITFYTSHFRPASLKQMANEVLEIAGPKVTIYLAQHNSQCPLSTRDGVGLNGDVLKV